MKVICLFFILINISGCGIQSIPKAANNVESHWAKVQNQYQRRMDLIPNILNSVKGYMKHESSTLKAVVEARAKATSSNVTFNNLNEGSLKKFSQAQGSLDSALSKLMVVVEKYPNLKADGQFNKLIHELEGTENRIAVARKRYIESIENFNNLITVPPTSFTNSFFYHHTKKPQFEVDNLEEAKKAPKVEF